MRKRYNELGKSVGKLPTGPLNSITDVPDVLVGHVTLKEELNEEKVIRTGVTAILPHSGNPFYEKVEAGSFVLNGFGKSTGLIQLQELGELESPIMLTNTFSVGAVLQGTLEEMLQHTPEIGDTTGSINIVVGECNDMFLNHVRSLPIKPLHARQAIQHAKSGKVKEGAVGAGTGMSCLGYKGGIGTSSRKIIHADLPTDYMIGTLVVSNFGRLSENPFLQEDVKKEKLPDGSIMIIIATDLPLQSRQLNRLAKRASIGLGRSGSHIHHGSGDIIIAFSNGNKKPHFSKGPLENKIILRDDHEVMNDIFQAVIEATEESIYNSLTMAETTKGRNGRVREGIPLDKIARKTN
ncbi:P1 family peptidase [Bacillaceae bacterium S4-13-58]